jgi:hypothetical protein
MLPTDGQWGRGASAWMTVTHASLLIFPGSADTR